jgi:hypothetical protein
MRRITVTGGDLFAVAARELGDATQWVRIARLNRIADPVLRGVVTLRLPEIDINAGGGIAV